MTHSFCAPASACKFQLDSVKKRIDCGIIPLEGWSGDIKTI